MRRAERRVPRQESGLVQCPLRDPPPGAKMLRVSAAKPAKAPPRGQSGGCPGSRPEAGRGRSSRRDAAVSCFNVSRGDQNDGPHVGPHDGPLGPAQRYHTSAGTQTWRPCCGRGPSFQGIAVAGDLRSCFVSFLLPELKSKHWWEQQEACGGGQRPPSPRDRSGGCGLCGQLPKTESGLEVGKTGADKSPFARES